MAAMVHAIGLKSAISSDSLSGALLAPAEIERETYKSSPWYRAYCSAMLQLDADKFLHEAEIARRAIQNRVAELVREKTGSNGEPTKLHEALDYLSLVLECFRQEGRQLLWR